MVDGMLNQEPSDLLMDFLGPGSFWMGHGGESSAEQRWHRLAGSLFQRGESSAILAGRWQDWAEALLSKADVVSFLSGDPGDRGPDAGSGSSPEDPGEPREGRDAGRPREGRGSSGTEGTPTFESGGPEPGGRAKNCPPEVRPP